MKLTRKMFLTAATSLLLMSTTQAQSLKEINFGIISTDSSSALKSLWQPFLDVASRMIVRAFYKQMRMRSVPVFHGPHRGFALERRLG